jgi:hypothetical protein
VVAVALQQQLQAVAQGVVILDQEDAEVRLPAQVAPPSAVRLRSSQ